MQKRLHSFIESCVNVLVGYAVAVGSQMIIFPMFDVHLSFSTTAQVGLWFTGVSVIRSYCLRRTFNLWTKRGSRPTYIGTYNKKLYETTLQSSINNYKNTNSKPPWSTLNTKQTRMPSIL